MMCQIVRTKPIGRDEDAAVPTTGVAFAIPTEVACRVVRITTGADAYVGIGADDEAPAASESNSVHHKSGTTDYYLDGIPQRDGSYVYVYSQATTIACDISFLG